MVRGTKQCAIFKISTAGGGIQQVSESPTVIIECILYCSIILCPSASLDYNHLVNFLLSTKLGHQFLR